MSLFPQSFIDDLKSQADIVQVVQDYVPLRKAGTSYRGLCPFHAEKTPSFHVHQDKGFFHCFGCGVGGDVLKFVELQEKLGFQDAVRHLANRVGVQIPEPTTDRDAAAEAEREALLGIHEAAAGFFMSCLAEASGRAARDHLAARGITADTGDRLGLGCAPPARDGLTAHLRARGYSDDLLVRSGLAVSREGGPLIDRFRNRLVIPIARDSGTVIAFGARALQPDQQPKYLNSPETGLYSKARTLYGLHLSKRAIREAGYAILVEGYFDLAQAVQAGVAPVVACCGTALGEQQVRLIKRFTSKVIVSFDPDPAGAGAAARSGELLLAQGLQVNVAVLEDGEDPDTCIRNHGVDRYRETLRASRPYLQYVLDREATERDLTRGDHQREFLTRMLEVAARIPEAAERDRFADSLAHRGGYSRGRRAPGDPQGGGGEADDGRPAAGGDGAARQAGGEGPDLGPGAGYAGGDGDHRHAGRRRYRGSGDRADPRYGPIVGRLARRRRLRYAQRASDGGRKRPGWRGSGPEIARRRRLSTAGTRSSAWGTRASRPRSRTRSIAASRSAPRRPWPRSICCGGRSRTCRRNWSL